MSPKKSRTWSRTITTITKPRTQSTLSRRVRARATGFAAGAGASDGSVAEVMVGSLSRSRRNGLRRHHRLADRLHYVLDDRVRRDPFRLALEVQDQPVPQGHRRHRPQILPGHVVPSV